MKANVALFIPTLLRGGGAEATVSKIAELLKNQYQIIIITLESGCDFDIDSSIPIISLTKLSGSSSDYYKLFSFFSQISKLKKILKDYKIDIILSFTERPNLLLSLVKSTNTKKVFCFRNYYSHHINDQTLWGLNWLRKLTFQWLANRLRKANASIVTISHEAKNDLIKNFGFKANHITVIYNFYDLNLIEEKSIEDNELYQNIFKEEFILSVGRLCHQKGQWILVKIFPDLLTINPKLKLVILGSGIYLSSLKKLCDDLQLTYSENPETQAEVYFLGVVRNPFIFYRKAKVFCLSSLWEGFPNVLLEAMSCKASVMANDCLSGPKEILFSKLDLDLQINQYQIADYGIMVSVKNLQLPDWFNLSLNQDEKNWLSAFRKYLSESDLQKDLKEKAYLRAKDFDLNQGKNNWIHLIEKVFHET